MQADIRPGMLVNMRRRLWRVESLEGGVLTATPVDDFGAPRQRFLAEIERIEPGRLEDPSVEVPGDPELHKLFLRALRLDAIHGTAPFLSLQRISVVPDEYQLVPLIMALRQQPVRMLIADTIGTGKTIEAGIIIKELLARNQARSVLIIVPAVLREQWREQMRDLFYLDFEIISSDTRKRLERSIPPGADPWLYFDRLIVSIDYAKAPHVRQDVLKRKWDIVVVDEAHNAAMPHSGTGRKADMERCELVRDVARYASRHLLLLTATPHNGYTDSFCSLLEMLSPRLVVGSGPDVRPNKEIGIAHVCQRTRDNIQDWFKEIGRRYPFPEREPQAETEVAVKLHSEYIGILSELEKVLDLVEAHARVMKKDQPIQWLRLHLFRRALSSPEALRISLRNRCEKLSPEPLEEEQMELEDEQEENLALASLTDRGADDADTEDETDRRVDSIALHIDRELQRKYFGDILQTLEKLDSSKDRKLAELRDRVIPSLFAKAGGDIPARIIVFTRYKDTLNYLERELSQNGDYQVFTLHGDMSEALREQRFTKFAQSDKAVLIATDVISEGLNLQAASCMIVNYDIPWNPNRIEQRIGRVDRFGQKSPKVFVRTLYCKDTQDDDVIDLFVRKFERIRRDLGATPPIFASEDTVRRILVRRRKRKNYEQQESLFDELDEDKFINEAIGAIKRDGFYGHTSIRISEVTERLNAAHERFGKPDQIRKFLQEGLRRYGCSINPVGDGLFKIEIKNPRLRVPGIGETIEQAVFDPNLRALHPQAHVIDIGHPVARRLSAVIREDALKSDRAGGARFAAWRVKNIQETVLLGHGLLRALAQTSPPTLLEEIVTFGIASGLQGLRILSSEEALKLYEAEPSTSNIQSAEAREPAERFYRGNAWEQARESAVNQALASLRDHRRRMKEELLSSGELSDDPNWLNGFDEIQMIGFDLYCLTLLLPEAR